MDIIDLTVSGKAFHVRDIYYKNRTISEDY